MTAYLLLFAAALGAGLMNSLAGGGSFLTFPALVFSGVPSILANATSTVALFPGVLASAWAYRQDFKSLERIPLKPALVVSVAGGTTGPCCSCSHRKARSIASSPGCCSGRP